MSAERKLLELGIVLPPAPKPSANYIPYRFAGDLMFLSGHAPRQLDGTYVSGKIRSEDDVEFGYSAARLAGLNMLSTIRQALHSLDAVEHFVKVLGMVNTSDDFRHHPAVMNGFSDLFTSVFGEASKHARSAVGMSSLPHGIPVEVEAILKVRR
ncbi:RidA family protein [Paraburkholderia sp. J63]|uniref:RidA family protein n=1 Tax=Paraburkholderia sp. J63 TaxID=2805434 RepID=UPI002ABDC412|nr:RidA family protein [Paraburkholderia sp. J63]